MRLLSCLAAVLLSAAGSARAAPSGAEQARIALGARLFIDPRLSRASALACSSCHQPGHAFSSPKALDLTADRKPALRNTPSLLDAGLRTGRFRWDGGAATLEEAIESCWTAQQGGAPAAVVVRLAADPNLGPVFQRTFGQLANPRSVVVALAAYVRTLRSGPAPWDAWKQGDKSALDAGEQRGEVVFFLAGCVNCHPAPAFTDEQFHNAGLGWDAANKSYRDRGRMGATGEKADEARFRTPSLREVSRTGPWFHDGSAATLEEAVDQMILGGVRSPGTSTRLQPTWPRTEDRRALVAFLRALSTRAPRPR